MGHRGEAERGRGAAPHVASCAPSVSRGDRGFTLVEVTTSVAVMLVVLTAAWSLLLVSNANLNTIENGGQSSEMNRAAMSYFERDLGHSILPREDMSPVLRAAPRAISFLADADRDGDAELITWMADDAKHTLLRVVTRTQDATHTPSTLSDFDGGSSTTETVMTGIASDRDPVTRARVYNDPPMFSYSQDAVSEWNGDLGDIGLVTLRIINGMPDYQSNQTDRTGSFRILALVINGY